LVILLETVTSGEVNFKFTECQYNLPVRFGAGVTRFSGRQPSRFQGPIRLRHSEGFATANDAAIQDVWEEIATPIRLRR
jgi:hypothetical protein